MTKCFSMMLLSLLVPLTAFGQVGNGDPTTLAEAQAEIDAATDTIATIKAWKWNVDTAYWIHTQVEGNTPTLPEIQWIMSTDAIMRAYVTGELHPVTGAQKYPHAADLLLADAIAKLANEDPLTGYADAAATAIAAGEKVTGTVVANGDGTLGYQSNGAHGFLNFTLGNNIFGWNAAYCVPPYWSELVPPPIN